MGFIKALFTKQSVSWRWFQPAPNPTVQCTRRWVVLIWPPPDRRPVLTQARLSPQISANSEDTETSERGATFAINFPFALREIINETKYLEQLGFPVPELARNVALQEDKFLRYRSAPRPPLGKPRSALPPRWHFCGFYNDQLLPVEKRKKCSKWAFPPFSENNKNERFHVHISTFLMSSNQNIPEKGR